MLRGFSFIQAKPNRRHRLTWLAPQCQLLPWFDSIFRSRVETRSKYVRIVYPIERFAEQITGHVMNTSPADREGFAAFLLRMRNSGIDDRLLMAAFEAVPRRDFIRPEFLSDVWSKRTNPIDCGETIEGADTQARLIRQLGIEEHHRVLEIGTGTGFTAAVMSKLAKRVFTIERFRTLSAAAATRIRELKIDNAIATHGDGSQGGTNGPFDRIITWAAFDNVPRIKN
jgi:protein-L-isoaspartate(D-aspartate) O-methyltransferase